VIRHAQILEYDARSNYAASSRVSKKSCKGIICQCNQSIHHWDLGRAVLLTAKKLHQDILFSTVFLDNQGIRGVCRHNGTQCVWKQLLHCRILILLIRARCILHSTLFYTSRTFLLHFVEYMFFHTSEMPRRLKNSTTPNKNLDFFDLLMDKIFCFILNQK